MEELNLKEMFKYFFKKLPIILLIAAIVFTSLEMYTYYTKKPLYKSDTTLLLIKTSDGSTSITQNDITLNQKLVTTYSQIMKSRRVLEQVISTLNLNYSVGELSSNVTVSSVSDTEIIKITVSDQSGAQSAEIANTLADVFTKEVMDIYKMENVSIIDRAIVSTTPFNINVIKDLIMYLGIGFVVGLGVVLVIFFLDTSIKSAEDIETKLNLPVLGTIPKSHRKKKGGKKHE